MMDHDDVPDEVTDEVARTTELRRSADQRAADARDAQTLAIRRAIEVGVPITALRDATGLSLARIYQIRDGRR